MLASINRGRPFVANREEAGDLDRVFRAFVDKATGGKKGKATEAGENAAIMKSSPWVAEALSVRGREQTVGSN